MSTSTVATVYPVEPRALAPCAIDLDAIRRIALRAPMLGDPMTMRASTLFGRLDRVLEQTALNRVLVVAHALAEIARQDASAATVFKDAGLARQIRSEVEARKAGAFMDFSEPVVRHAQQDSHAPTSQAAAAP